MKRLIYILCSLLIFQIGYGQEGGVTKSKAEEDSKSVQTTVEVNTKVSKKHLILNRDTKEKLPLSEFKTDKEKLQEFGFSQFNNQYFKYLNSPLENKDYSALKNAYKLDPNNKELHFEMAKYYELSTDVVNKKSICVKLNQNLSSGLKEYAFNTLMSVEKNGILITYGEDDTYPLWILQELEGVRKDVKILNYDLLANNQYREKQKAKLGLVLADSYVNNIDVLKDIAVNNPSKSVYYSLTVSHLVLKQLKTKLYATGLALKYSMVPLNNSNSIKANWEKKFKKVALKSSNKNYTDKKIEMNYLVSLVQLGRYYKTKNKQKEYNEVKEIALAIAERNGKKSQVTKLFNK